MKKMIQIFNSHKWVILLAFTAAVIIAYPQIYLRNNLGDSYRGIEVMGAGDDEISWLSRVREAQDGHPALSCVYLKDGKDDPYLIQPLGTMLFASLGKIFSFDINNTLLFSRLFFSFIVFLIIYAFVYLFSKEKLIALTAATALILGRDIFSRGGIQELIAMGSPSFKYLNLVRPVNPLMTYFFLFGFLLFFWLFYTRKQWRWGILSILFLGLSFYDYFFTWTFLYVFCGLLMLIFIFQKKWHDAKKIVLVLLGAAAIAIPYFLNMYQVLIHPNYTEVAQRFGLVGGHAPILGILAPLLFAVVLLFFPRKWKERYLFVLALAATPFIVLNQQVITGKALSSVHYHWYFTWPLAIIFLFVVFFLRCPQKKWLFLKKFLAILSIFFITYVGILVQSSSYYANKEAIAEKQRYGQVMDWLNQNAQKEDVVFTDDETAGSIFIYTPLNVFYHFKASSCLAASRERLLNGLFLLYRLDGVEKEKAQEFFFKDRKNISHSLYSMYYYFTTGDESGIPDEIILDLSQKYRESFNVSTPDFISSLFSKYEVKYVVWDKRSNPRWQFDQYLFLEKAAEINDFVIYGYASI